MGKPEHEQRTKNGKLKTDPPKRGKGATLELAK